MTDKKTSQEEENPSVDTIECCCKKCIEKQAVQRFIEEMEEDYNSRDDSLNIRMLRAGAISDMKMFFRKCYPSDETPKD